MGGSVPVRADKSTSLFHTDGHTLLASSVAQKWQLRRWGNNRETAPGIEVSSTYQAWIRIEEGCGEYLGPNGIPYEVLDKPHPSANACKASIGWA